MSTLATRTGAGAAEKFSERLLEAVATTFNVFGMYLGDQLGFYDVLAQDGPLSAAQLAARTGTDQRYVREWLEHQAVAGVLTVDGGNGDRRFTLRPGAAEVLADRDSLNYLAPLVQLAAGAVRPLERLVRAYRQGGGVPFDEYGSDLREGQGRMNRAASLQLLGPVWIPAMPDVCQRLTTHEDARIADIGCGVGWASIGLALAYPKAHVDGFDTDEASVRRAAEHAVELGVSERVRFTVRDAGDAELRGRYDLVVALECIHDMSNPVAALGTMRRLARGDGAVLVVDERVADEFDPEAGVVESLMYGFSILHCLPAGMADQPSAATGTVMRIDTLRKYAEAAGFRGVEVLAIDNPLLRFYRLLL